MILIILNLFSLVLKNAIHDQIITNLPLAVLLLTLVSIILIDIFIKCIIIIKLLNSLKVFTTVTTILLNKLLAITALFCRSWATLVYIRMQSWRNVLYTVHWYFYRTFNWRLASYSVCIIIVDVIVRVMIIFLSISWVAIKFLVPYLRLLRRGARKLS